MAAPRDDGADPLALPDLRFTVDLIARNSPHEVRKVFEHVRQSGAGSGVDGFAEACRWRSPATT